MAQVEGLSVLREEKQVPQAKEEWEWVGQWIPASKWLFFFCAGLHVLEGFWLQGRKPAVGLFKHRVFELR